MKKEGLFDDSGDEEEMYKPQEEKAEETVPEVKPDPVGALAEVMDDDEDKKKVAPTEDTAVVEENKEDA